jgi:hypothetical protein
MSVVYFIQAGNDGPIKIGVTRSLDIRLPMLQTGSPYLLVVLATINGGHELESAYHRALCHHRMRSEWFYPTSEVLRHVALAAEGIAVECTPCADAPKVNLGGSQVAVKDMVATMGGVPQAQAASLFDLPPSTIYSWVKRGIPHYRVPAIEAIYAARIAALTSSPERLAIPPAPTAPAVAPVTAGASSKQ